MVLDKSYHLGRQKGAWKYRLERRTQEVIKAIRMFQPDARELLDVGAADGAMLSKLMDEFHLKHAMGLEYSQELIDCCKDTRLIMVHGNAEDPPFIDCMFDVVVATAVIEHLKKPQVMLAHAARVLRVGGILVLTTPSPFFEKLDSRFRETSHALSWSLSDLRIAVFPLVPIYGKKFMMAPGGFPHEESIEKWWPQSLLMNQLMVAKRV